MSTEQQENIERVRGKIGYEVLKFCAEREEDGRGFRLNELEEHISKACPTHTFGSAGRILRDLQARGFVAYTVVSRRESLYTIIGTAKGATA